MTIKELRLRTNLSQRQFAKEINIPLSTLQHWEQDYCSPPRYLIPLLIDALKYRNILREDFANERE